MGRLYSGNLAAYKDAIERIKEDYDVNVVIETFRYMSYARMRWVAGDTIRVVLRNGVEVTSKRFEHDDEDVRCNAQTEWLRKVHSDLRHWK